MDMRIGPAPLGGRVDMISSKSQAHRIMIAAALSQETVQVQMEGLSQDVEATIGCLNALGADISKMRDDLWQVRPILKNRGRKDFQKEEKPCLLDCKESGSTLRFLLPVAAALGEKTTFTGKGRLPQRPVGQLLSQLRKHGCKTDREEGLPLTLEGRLQGGDFTLPGNVSSQFVTGLLFALPLLEEDSRILLSSPLESAEYIRMTLSVLGRFGIRVTWEEERFLIRGRQRYRPMDGFGEDSRIQVEGDWSAAAFWLCAAASGACNEKGGISCRGLDPASSQGDRKVTEILKDFGARVQVGKDSLVTARGPEKGGLKGIQIDAAQIPDLVPVLAVVGACARGRTDIINGGRLRIKESDRLSAMARELGRLGVQIKEKPEGLVIQGLDLGGEPCPKKEEIKKKEAGRQEPPVRISGWNDHRIVMAMAIAAVVLKKEIVIEGAEAVKKSYPDFFTRFRELGGEADVL